MNFDPRWLPERSLSNWKKHFYYPTAELRQAIDEGKDVEKYRKLAEAIDSLEDSVYKEELGNIFFQAIYEAPIRADFPYAEPDKLDEIFAARPKDRMEWAAPAKDDALAAKIRGAWLGRICGCLLGKPVECMRTADLHALLKGSDNFPLRRYMTKEDAESTISLERIRKDAKWIDLVDGAAPVDDDTNYTVMAAYVIGKYGRDFTPDNMACAWLDCQPWRAYCTAEHRAYRNFMIGIQPPLSAVYKNPDREFIGAQIRGDYFGYINPGNPELAADMAWRDGCISHVKNGIYGEMFIAAMIAVAAVCDDVRTVVLEGLKQIPENCRLTEAIKKVVAWYDEGVTQAECFARINAEWNESDGYEWVHTISNAMIVVASLLYGEKDYSKSICMAVEIGFDTDCNGATVGSILGMMLGETAIGEEWTAPICGKLKTSLFGMDVMSIDELAEMTLKHMA